MNTRRLFVLLFTVALFTMAVRETLDPDMWWHLRAGEYILQNGIPHQDVFSFTVPDHEWITHEWLSEVIMWIIYQAAGLPGLIIAFAAITAATFGLVYLVCAGRPFLAAFVVLLAASTSAIVWGVRPQMFSLLLTAAFVFIVERYRSGHFTHRALWWLPPLTAVWANLHSGYLLGVVLLATYVGGEAVKRFFVGRITNSPSSVRQVSNLPSTLDWPQIRTLAVITALSFLAAALNPNGPSLWIYPFFTLGSSAMQVYIQEWHSPDFHHYYFWPFGLLMTLGVTSWLYSRHRPAVTELLLFGGTAAAGLISARNIPIFAVVVPAIISRHLLSALSQTAAFPLLSGQSTPPRPTRLMAVFNWFLLALAVLAALGWTAGKILGNEEAIAARYPVQAVDYLESAGLVEARVYNSYNWGGYLIWRGLPVFVDGRADVYGDDFLFYYRRAFDATPRWQDPLKEYDVECVLMEGGSPLGVVLVASGRWSLIYEDEQAQLFRRTP
jgi:hypothetical protein